MPAPTPTAKLRPIAPLDVAWMQWWAAPHPNPSKLAQLLASGGKDYRGMDGCGPLVWALRQQRGKARAFVQALLDAGLDPDEPQSSMSPVFEACYQRDMKSLELLLSRGACPNGQQRSRPIGQAFINESDFRFVQALVAAGASIAPGLRFDGVAQTLGSREDDFHKFKPTRRWNQVAQLIAQTAPGQWDEFASQMNAWADQVGDADFVASVREWVASCEASMVLGVSTHSASAAHRPSPRI